ncbi:hypothetical protein [Dolichospermum sp. UHCC 0259]|jgi:hypothetical protein|uniref:hypothetical protein n=1 Tax=Dolichospermum sp. UHCC 0259 TaxID=2590010 RepID=UPI001445C487|nr:hypothetical protein [Dolichospermum sp. UHCC 0259]MTJ49496.1 hypothetical protein [Dolichospermum sp. UHCC 0259]
MNSRQIESWALRVIDCVKRGQPNEDFLVELKRDWIDEAKAARRIAGHANAARGENILWLIGFDEKEGVDCVIGANTADLASWYSKVESFFNELAPRMIPLNIPVDNKTVVALLFETDRAPFVIKNQAYGSPGGGSVELEVPWRENTAIRSARRSDLIRLLAPLELLPEIEILDINLAATIGGKDSEGNYHSDELRLNSELYIVPKNRERVIIPFHLCRVEFEIYGIPTFESNWISLNPASGINDKPGSLTIESTRHEIIINGPGKLSLKAAAEIPSLPEDAKNCDIRISIYLLPTGANRPVVLTKILPYPKEKSSASAIANFLK